MHMVISDITAILSDLLKKLSQNKASPFLTVVAMETENKDFLEIGRKLPNEKCEIDTFQDGFCNMSFLLITFTTSSV